MAEGAGDFQFKQTYTVVAWNWKSFRGGYIPPEVVDPGYAPRGVAQCNSKVSNDIAWKMLDNMMREAGKRGAKLRS